MKKKKIIIIVIAAIFIVWGLVFGIKTVNQEKEEKIIQTIKTEYSNIVDARIKEYLSRSYDELSESEKEYCITNINYEILDISKKVDFFGGEVYVISLEIYVESANDSMSDTNSMSDTMSSLLYHDVEDDIFVIEERDYIGSDFYIAGYQCSYTPPLDERYIDYDARVTSYVNNYLVSAPEDSKIEITNSKDTVKCESCEHSFKKDSENAMSIARTHMCTKCYNNYKSLSDWLDEQPVD